MRRFSDVDGKTWEVVVGRESWGVFVALFIPVDGDPDIRQAPLVASGYDEAYAELSRLDDSGLTELLRRSVPNVLGE